MVQNAVKLDGLGDVLYLLLAKVFIPQVELILDLITRFPRHIDTGGIGHSFWQSVKIDPTLAKVIALRDILDGIDADAELYAPIFGACSISGRHGALYFSAALHCIYCAVELRKNGTFCGTDDTPTVLRYAWIDELTAMRRYDGARLRLVGFDELGITDHVRGEDCRRLMPGVFLRDGFLRRPAVLTNLKSA